MQRINYENEAILPVRYPIITSYQPYATMLSILSNYKETEAWIFNNFINIRGEEAPLDDPNKNRHHKLIRFSSFNIMNSCPFILNTKLERVLIDNQFDNVIDFLITSISLGYYVSVYANYFYIPPSHAYRKQNYNHWLFIYGFNRQTKQFHIADFFRNSFSYEKASFEEVENAINNKETLKRLYNTVLHKYKNRKVDFDINLMQKELNNFLNSTCTLLNYETNNLEFREQRVISSGKMTFGMANYDLIKNCLCEIITNNISYTDIRPFHVFYDHKVMMNYRICFLKDNGIINDISSLREKFHKIENDCLINRSLFIKYLTTSNKSILEKIIGNIDSVKAEEIIAINDLLGELQKQNT